MKTFVALLLLAFTQSASADLGGPWKILFQNQKMPTQAMLEHYVWSGPAAASATGIAASKVIASTGGATLITSGLADIAVARNVTLTPTGTTANVAAGTAVVTGKSINGAAISENFSITSAQSSATTGSKAFKSVTSVSFPQASGSGVTLSIGIGSKLGIPHCMDRAGEYVFSEFNSVYDTTRGTMAVSSAAAESNTFTSNTSLNGSRVDLFYVQNFRCF